MDSGAHIRRGAEGRRDAAQEGLRAQQERRPRRTRRRGRVLSRTVADPLGPGCRSAADGDRPRGEEGTPVRRRLR